MPAFEASPGEVGYLVTLIARGGHARREQVVKIGRVILVRNAHYPSPSSVGKRRARLQRQAIGGHMLGPQIDNRIDRTLQRGAGLARGSEYEIHAYVAKACGAGVAIGAQAVVG